MLDSRHQIYERFPRACRVAAAIYAYTPRLHLVRKAEILSFYDADLRKKPLVALRYLVSDPELTNFTYPIANQDELAQFVADATGTPVAEVTRISTKLSRTRSSVAPSPTAQAGS